ncbi:MAG: 5-oxoprolinase subunit B family protein, partial [Actinomycetes bacterium]
WPAPPPRPAADGGLVELPVRYQGPDLHEVARRWGMSPAEVVVRHTSTAFTVAFCGFSPGFAYLSGLPPRLEVPRRATPRVEVAAGSVGLAGPWCAVYPSASPGGWQIIGRTAVPLFHVDRDPPALLVPGTRVRFVDDGSAG